MRYSLLERREQNSAGAPRKELERASLRRKSVTQVVSQLESREKKGVPGRQYGVRRQRCSEQRVHGTAGSVVPRQSSGPFQGVVSIRAGQVDSDSATTHPRPTSLDFVTSVKYHALT